MTDFVEIKDKDGNPVLHNTAYFKRITVDKDNKPTIHLADGGFLQPDFNYEHLYALLVNAKHSGK